jgi:SPW repeat
MRPWTRLQDWGTLLAGLYAALSPIWVSTTGERDAFWALIVLGGSTLTSGRLRRQAIQP